MNNKKKILVILIAVFLCSGMFFISDMIKYSNSTKNATKIESEVKNSNSDVNNTENNSENKKEANDESNDSVTTDNTNEQQDGDKSTENKSTTTDNKEKTEPTSQTQAETQQQTQPKAQSSKVIIQNGISGSTILSKSINANNMSVGEATTSALDSNGVDYKVTGFGPTMYIASIAGLSEKAEGPTSGWTYYVQKGGSGSFVKPSVSCGSYKLQDGDVVLWKYVKEGA